MTLDEAMEKVKALWPQHDVTQTPLSAKGMLKILEELGLIKFESSEFKFDPELGEAIFNIEHPVNTKTVPEDINPGSVETVELTAEQIKGNAKEPLKASKKKAAANEG